MGGVVALGVIMGAVLLAVPFVATATWSAMWLIQRKGLRLVLRLIGRHMLTYLKVVGFYILFAITVLPFFRFYTKELLLNLALLAFFAWEAFLFYKEAARLLSPPKP